MPDQRDIVEVPYYLPQGAVEPHPAIVISNEAIHEIEGIFYAVLCSSEVNPEEFSIELTADMINGHEMKKKTYVKTHMIQSYQIEEIMQHRGSVTVEAFKEIKENIIAAIFDAA